jgi:ribosomal protein S18 acetylase RimI-like enzyme
MNLTIRRANIQDIDDIIKLNKILFDLEYKNFDNTLDTERPFSNEWINYFKGSVTNSITMVAIVDDKIVGYMIWNLNSQYSYNTVKQAELNNMCILDEYRKLWIGTKFITEFKRICKDNNIQEIKVIASYENTNAISFYKKNGFNESELTLKIKI